MTVGELQAYLENIPDKNLPVMIQEPHRPPAISYTLYRAEMCYVGGNRYHWPEYVKDGEKEVVLIIQSDPKI